MSSMQAGAGSEVTWKAAHRVQTLSGHWSVAGGSTFGLQKSHATVREACVQFLDLLGSHPPKCMLESRPKGVFVWKHAASDLPIDIWPDMFYDIHIWAAWWPHSSIMQPNALSSQPIPGRYCLVRGGGAVLLKTVARSPEEKKGVGLFFNYRCIPWLDEMEG